MVRLIVPPEWYTLTDEQRADICNGCGAKNSRLPVPDTIWGLCIKRACDAHDLCYHLGKDKDRSDAAFLVNVLLLIQDAFYTAPAWMKWVGLAFVIRELRRVRAMTYYAAVSDLGAAAYRRAG